MGTRDYEHGFITWRAVRGQDNTTQSALIRWSEASQRHDKAVAETAIFYAQGRE
jgi:hypothetical protein